MKKRFLKYRFYKALLLIVVFTAPHFIQPLHCFFGDEIEHVDWSKKNNHTVFSKAQNKCVICDFKLYQYTPQSISFINFIPQQILKGGSESITYFKKNTTYQTRLGRAPPRLNLF